MPLNNGHLRELRIKAKYTQQEVADILGVTKSTISKYEKGLRGINSSHLEKLSELYKTEPIFILTGKTSKEWQDRIEKEEGQAQEEERAYWESVLLSNAVRSLTPLLDKLNDEGQKKAVERVEELTEIPKYQRQELPTAPSEGTDTAPAENAATEPPEDK